MLLITAAFSGLLLGLISVLGLIELLHPGVTIRIITVYVDLFSGFTARHPHYVRLEHREIVHSIEAAYDARRDAGANHIVATTQAVCEHLGELQPIALARKTRADDQAAAGRARTEGCDSQSPIEETAGWRFATGTAGTLRGLMTKVGSRRDHLMNRLPSKWTSGECTFEIVALAVVVAVVVAFIFQPLTIGDLPSVALRGLTGAISFAIGLYIGIVSNKKAQHQAD